MSSSMLPAATSCSSGFQRWVRARSTRVTWARFFFPILSPSFVASSSPPAPPPTMTIRCSDELSMLAFCILASYGAGDAQFPALTPFRKRSVSVNRSQLWNLLSAWDVIRKLWLYSPALRLWAAYLIDNGGLSQLLLQLQLPRKFDLPPILSFRSLACQKRLYTDEYVVAGLGPHDVSGTGTLRASQWHSFRIS